MHAIGDYRVRFDCREGAHTRDIWTRPRRIRSIELILAHDRRKIVRFAVTRRQQQRSPRVASASQKTAALYTFL